MAKKQVEIYVYDGEIYVEQGKLRDVLSDQFDDRKKELELTGGGSTLEQLQQMIEIAAFYADINLLSQTVTIEAGE